MAENPKIDDLGGFLRSKEGQPFTKSPDYLSVYANNVQLAVSAFDFSLTFGEMTDEMKGDDSIVNQKVRVILSKEMVKVLLTLLDVNVKAYEAQFGEIVLPTPKRMDKIPGLVPMKEGAKPTVPPSRAKKQS